MPVLTPMQRRIQDSHGGGGGGGAKICARVHITSTKPLPAGVQGPLIRAVDFEPFLKHSDTKWDKTT